jgi:hypothetical protein
MEKIFLNFRTGDQDMAAPFLHRYLTRWFGADAVFFSSRSIPAGAAFPDELLRHAEQCQVLLALIGPQWLTMAGSDGRPLLANPADWVRREIATALAAGRRVIPVLVANAPRLTAPRLPADLAPLADAEYRYLRRRDLAADLHALQEDLMKLIPGLRLRPRADPPAGISVDVGRNSGSVTGVRVDELRTRGAALPDLFGNVSARADQVDPGGVIASAHIGKWDRLEPSSSPAQRDDSEEWGNADGEHQRRPELPA